MPIITEEDMNKVHKIYLKHLQNLEGDMVENGYNRNDVIQVCLLFIHSLLHNNDIDYKIEAYHNIINHFLGIMDNIKKTGSETPKK